MTILSCKELETQLDLGWGRCWKMPAGKAKERMEDAWCKLLEEYKDQFEWEKALGA